MSPLEEPGGLVRTMEDCAKASSTIATHEIRLSMDVSIGVVLRDFRKDARPGVKAAEVDGIVLCETRSRPSSTILNRPRVI